MSAITPPIGDYKSNRARWIKMFIGDIKSPDDVYKPADPNVIVFQLYAISLNIACYKGYMKAVELAEVAHGDGSSSSILINQLVMGSFPYAQATAIRRQTDRREDTYSLQRVVNEMRARRSVLRREEMIAQDKRIFAPLRLDATSLQEELNFRELLYDIVCGTTAATRAASDLVSDSFLEKLQAKLTICENVVEYVHKYCAHTATPGSRKNLNPSQNGLTLKQLIDAHQALCEVNNCLLQLLNMGFSIALYATDPLLTHLNTPLVSNADLGKVGSVLDSYYQEVGRWDSYSCAELMS